MIILSNCLTDVVDEGCRKVANSLVKRIRQAHPQTTVVSYESTAHWTDIHLQRDPFLCSRQLTRLLRSKREPLLYVPAPAKALPLGLRLFILSLFARWGLHVLLPMQFPVSRVARWLIKLSKAKLVTISGASQRYYEQRLGGPVHYCKVGVDAEYFRPVSPEEKLRLRQQYGIPADKKVVLHVGHLRPERNVEQLLKLSEEFHGILVVSTQTAAEQDPVLRRRLTAKSNLTLMEDYLPNIQQIYQLADVYLFPVEDAHACIDSPLSALEAAACDVPVVTTPFGGLQELLGQEGFYEIRSMEPQQLNALLHQACAEQKKPRQNILNYDWDKAVQCLLRSISGK